MSTIPFCELWRHFRLLSDPQSLEEQDKTLLQGFLQKEYALRHQRRLQRLLRISGIKRVKLLTDFDWLFNPQIPRDKIMEYMNTVWLTRPSSLIIIGPSGVGKTHIATAFCHDAVMKGHQTLFLSLFDLQAKMARAKTIYSFVEHYAKTPVLCIDELGYTLPTKEQADCLFQIISKRYETGTTIITTNLIPSQWGKVFETVTASAILDRLSMNGTFLTFGGNSYRRK
jgi:DNA replication protein DnaC